MTGENSRVSCPDTLHRRGSWLYHATSHFPLLGARLGNHADRLWMIALALVAGIYALQYNILLQPIPPDTTFHIYAAQQILDGHPIYRDVAIIKAPLSDFATALALIGARAIGISDIMGARLMSLLVAMATTSVTYLAGRVLLNSRAVGILAALVMAGYDFYGWRAITGPEPKAFVILFAFLAFLSVAKRRWIWAGVCAMLSALAWQPSLMVVAFVLAAAASHEPSSFRISDFRFRIEIRALQSSMIRVARVAFGAMLPLLAVIIYLVANDALSAAFNLTIRANLMHWNTSTAQRSLWQIFTENVTYIWNWGRVYCFSPIEHRLVAVGILGLVGIFGAEIRAARQQKRLPITLERTPWLLYSLGFAAFSVVDFNFCPDLFPILPSLALGVGWLGWQLARGVNALVARFTTVQNTAPISQGLVTLMGLALIAIYFLDVRGYVVRGTNFHDQQDVTRAVQKYLATDDRVLSFGNVIALVELRRANASKILHLGSKSGLGVLATEPGGMQGLVAALDRDPPKVITLAREHFPDWAQPFYEWLKRRYVLAETLPRVGVRVFVLVER